MKAIILAAGQGKRLRPLTESIPKCMVPFKGKQIIDYILETLRACGIDDIYIVKGYKAGILKKENTKEFINHNYLNTNMVASLFCSESVWNEDIIISYGDIIYDKKIIEKLKNSDENISVIVDKNWKQLWQKRMENPLDDAETLKLDDHDNIIELGKKPKSYDEIQGQYIGLIKIKKNVIKKIKKFYYSLDKKKNFDGKNFNNMFMTSFLQLIINELMPIKAIKIFGGWIEIDTLKDITIFENNF